MRHVISALAVTAAAFFSSAAMAQGYVGIGAGTGKVDACDGVPSCDTTDTAFKLYGGYKFAYDIAAEAGYYSFGKASVSQGSASSDAKVTAPAIGVAYLPQLTDDWGLAARLGIASVKTKLTASAPGIGFNFSDSETKTALYYGIGVNYSITKGMKLELGADFSRAEYDGEKADVRAITIGLRAEF